MIMAHNKRDTNYYMQIALKEAYKSLKNNDVPVGAIIVYKDKIISRAYNKIEKSNNSLLHAEILAINSAIKKYDYKHLLDCELYVTLEPCSMCAGAIVLSRIKKVYIAAKDSKSGACGSIINLVQNKSLNHQCELETGILENESSKLLKDFFKKLRDQKKNWKLKKIE